MVKESSPFTPGVPVPVDFFVGRRTEIERLLQSVREVAGGKQRNVFLAGERGIGKSSLARVTRFLARRDHDLLCVQVLLGGVTDLGEMVRRILERLVNDSRG
ncbi:MAG: ATP-binding protein, partial [Planctomycetota bacterium]